MSDADPTPDSAPQEQASPTSRQRSVALKNLFLDPNNYRFIDQQDYTQVGSDKLTDAEVQRRTTALILGQNAEEVKDLISSFRKNGWLPVDQIQVKQLGKGRYLVVEGNRRVAALHWLNRRHSESALDLGKLDPGIFDAVPVVLYDEADEAHHLVVMGLGHISGKKRWPAINQARLLKNLIEMQAWRENDVCDAVGVSKRELRTTLKTLQLCDLYRNSDYGDQFRTEKFNLFREVVRSREVSAWLGLNEEGTPTHTDRQARLFAWLSSDDAPGDDDEPVRLDPAINTGTDVRQLARIIDDEIALKSLDETRRLSDATSLSKIVVKDRIDGALNDLHWSLGILYNDASSMEAQDRSRAQEAVAKLRGLIEAFDRQPRLLGDRVEKRVFNQARQAHFLEVELDSFRCFRGLKITDLRRINLFVGPNNTGKTSILEAVQLLIAQNDVEELLRVVCRRGKIVGSPPAIWLKEQISAESRISGKFDRIPNNQATVVIRNEQNAEDLQDKTFYVTSLEIEASYAGQQQSAVTHLFDKKERLTRGSSVHVLCPAVFSSPFLQQDTDVLAGLFDQSVRSKSKEDVIAFIRETLDPDFKDVDSTALKETASFTRFQVSHGTFSSSIDLTQFGEGVQRIFYIGLLFAYARGGVVLIDEFENAIHYSLLRPLVGLVHRLAERFDTQVFITSHSKECVDAFGSGAIPDSDLSAYALRRENGQIRCYAYPGERLHRLIADVDVDLRGTAPKS